MISTPACSEAEAYGKLQLQLRRSLEDKSSFTAFKSVCVFHRGVKVQGVAAIATLDILYNSQVRSAHGYHDTLMRMGDMKSIPDGTKYKTSRYRVVGLEIVGPLKTLCGLDPQHTTFPSTHDHSFLYEAGKTYVSDATPEELSKPGCGKGLYFFLHPKDAVHYQGCVDLKSCDAVVSKPLFEAARGGAKRPFAIANTMLKPADIVTCAGMGLGSVVPGSATSARPVCVVKTIVDKERGIVLVEDLGLQWTQTEYPKPVTPSSPSFGCCVMCNHPVTLNSVWNIAPGLCTCILHKGCAETVFAETGRCVYCFETVNPVVVEPATPEADDCVVSALTCTQGKLEEIRGGLKKMRLAHMSELTRLEEDLSGLFDL